MINIDEIQETCYNRAFFMLKNNMTRDMNIFQLTDLLVAVEIEKLEKQQKCDEGIDYNDEIISIEPAGDLETVDISVTGDQLFYCNNILTKNSMGIVHTADAVFALIVSEEYDELGQIGIKQLKNRWGDLSYYRRFVLGIERAKMKLFDVEDSAQIEKPVDKEPVFDKSRSGGELKVEFGNKKKNFFNMDFEN